jgi:hypothetical protein
MLAMNLLYHILNETSPSTLAIKLLRGRRLRRENSWSSMHGSKTGENKKDLNLPFL